MEKSNSVTESTDEIDKYVKNVLEVLETIKVPGFEEVLAPLNAILKAFEPDPLSEIKKGIDQANDRLNNMFNVIVSALDYDDIKDAVTNAENGLQNLENKLTEISEQPSKVDSTFVDIIYTFEIKNQFHICLNNSTSYIKGYEKAQKSVTQPLAEHIGGYMFALEQLQEIYVIFIEASRKIIDFYKVHPEKCNEDNWKPFLKTVDSLVKSNSIDYSEFIEKKIPLYCPQNIQLIVNDNQFCVKLRDKKRFLFWNEQKCKSKIFETCTKNSPIPMDKRTYYLLKCYEQKKDFSLQDYQFKLINLSNPDNDSEAKWGLVSSFVDISKNDNFKMAVTKTDCYNNHSCHKYVVSHNHSGTFKEGSIFWEIQVLEDGSLQFRLNQQQIMRENWSSLTIENKNKYSQWNFVKNID